MTSILIGSLFLMALLWTLLKLRDLREQNVEEELPGDKITILLGVFLLLSKACLAFHRDTGNYPKLVHGPDGLIEGGYLKNDPLAKMTKIIPLFTIIDVEGVGVGVCLINTPASLATEIIQRVKETNSMEFANYRSGELEPISLPITPTMVNLTLMLPKKPKDLNAK